MNLVALRGATTAAADEREAILAATEELLGRLLSDNGLAPRDLVSLIFTATPDLSAAFPAEGARRMGLDAVPLLCATEMQVPGAPARCIRVLVHLATARDPASLRPVYLGGAAALREDLQDPS